MVTVRVTLFFNGESQSIVSKQSTWAISKFWYVKARNLSKLCFVSAARFPTVKNAFNTSSLNQAGVLAVILPVYKRGDVNSAIAGPIWYGKIRGGGEPSSNLIFRSLSEGFAVSCVIIFFLNNI